MTTDRTKSASADKLASLPLLIPVPKAAQLLGISRAAAYRHANAGDLPCKRLGRRLYIITARLREFIETGSEVGVKPHERARLQARQMLVVSVRH